VIGVLRALAATVSKMFVADLWLTLTALAAIGFCAAGLRFGFIGAATVPFVVAAGVFAALIAGVARGARR
jgi:hypothetical protein